MKPIEKCNLGVRPVDALGRGEEPSEVVKREELALKAYATELRTIGVVDSAEKAKLARLAMVHYAMAFELAKGDKGCKARALAKEKKLHALFKSLNLSY